MKNPYAIWSRKLITIELFYDVAAFLFLLAIVIIAVVHRSILERAIELVFFLKVAKPVKFDVCLLLLALLGISLTKLLPPCSLFLWLLLMLGLCSMRSAIIFTLKEYNISTCFGL